MLKQNPRSQHFLEWKCEGMNPLEKLHGGLDMTDSLPVLVDRVRHDGETA